MRRGIILFAIALVLGGLIWVVPYPIVRYGMAFVLLWVLTGLAWASLIPGSALGLAERLTVSLGLCFVVTPIATLLASYLPGPLTRASLLAAIVGSVGLPVLLSRFVIVSKEQQAQTGFNASAGAQHHASFSSMVQRLLWQEGWAWMLVAISIAVGLRVVNLNYSEFQGDEATVLVRAARALEGDETIAFEHTKGPAELMVVMASWRLAGAINEWMARLPFAWAGVLGLVAVFLCGRRLGRSHVGGMAACLLAINGYFVAFGRVVQYQSLVFALSTLGFLCLLVYHGCGRGALVSVSAALLAAGFLAHYDAALILPAGLFLIGDRLRLDRRRVGRAWVSVIGGGLVGVALVGVFYLPFLYSPYVEFTSSYLSGRIGRGLRMYNHLWSAFKLSAVYNSVYFLVGMALVVAAYTWILWAKRGRAGWILSAVLLVAVSTGLLRPDLWQVNGREWVWVPAALLLVGTLLSPALTVGVRAVWLWFGLPAWLYLFFVAQPWTHIHTAFPAWSVLCGIGIAGWGRWLARRSRALLRVTAVLGAAIYALCAAYAVMTFVDHTPEYERTFPRSRHPLYWTPYHRMPKDGLFGFPYRAGWNVVGRLIDGGKLAGSYNSNEERAITDYYTRQSLRLGYGDIDMYILATHVRDEVNIHWKQVQAGYKPAVVVTVGGQPKLTVYRRDVTGSPLTLAVEDGEQLFAPRMTPDQVSQPAVQKVPEVEVEEYVPCQAVLGGVVQLLGYKVDTRYAVPGGYVELILLWRGLERMSMDYHVFTHLYDGQAIHGQMDGEPMYSTYPTSHWEPGRLVADTYRIPIQDGAPCGAIPLIVGMYDFETMQRLDVVDVNDRPAGDSVHLTDVVVRCP